MITRPILFSGAMVRALLDGSKTQTRRALKVRCQEIGERDDGSRWPWSENPDTAADHWHVCPYGHAGDRLWVRETFCDLGDGEIEYRADGECDPNVVPRWTPSIHMPRAASRILLEIVAVRVERLQDITEGDAWAEGVDKAEVLSMPCADGATAAYSALWQRINGAGSWEANPWVWVVEFKRTTP
jgi:hypothetical protein